MRLSPNEIAWCALHAGFKGDDVAIATAVALAESKGETEALGWVPGTATKPASGNYDHGLWQISSLWHGAELLLSGADWRDPTDNAAMAYLIWQQAKGWSPWSTFKSGAYELLMPFGTLAAKYPWAPPSPMRPVLNMTGSLTITSPITGEVTMQGPMS